MLKLIILTIFFCSLSYASEKELEKKAWYQQVFPKYDALSSIVVKDTISDEPVNTTILKVENKGVLLGFIREISTTTGCNSACLPIIYTSFYNEKGELLQIKSQVGLTKIEHAAFTEEDKNKLDLILAMAPKEFDTITHPKELTDAISGETLKKYKHLVVPGAAYSTLRTHLYNQDTKKQIKAYLKKIKLK